MKHYTPEKWREYELFRPRLRREVGCKPKYVADTKARYRRRERTALKREIVRAYETYVHDRAAEVEHWTHEAEMAMAELIEIEAYGDAMRYTDAFVKLYEAQAELSELR